MNSEVNKMVRILQGERLKYTVRVNLPDGSSVEFQSDVKPEHKYRDQGNSLWLYKGDEPIMQWRDGSVLICEENT